MKTKRYKVWAYAIKYDGRSSIMSICGLAALKSFAEEGKVNMYDSACAPKELDLDVVSAHDPIDEIELFHEDVLSQLSDETGLTVVSCSWRYAFIEDV